MRKPDVDKYLESREKRDEAFGDRVAKYVQRLVNESQRQFRDDLEVYLGLGSDCVHLNGESADELSYGLREIGPPANSIRYRKRFPKLAEAFDLSGRLEDEVGYTIGHIKAERVAT